METKICKRCHEEKNILEFNWHRKAKGTRQTYCKVCQSLYTREHYSKNKKAYIDRAHKRNAAYKQVSGKWVWDYLLLHPCVDCGESDPIVLEFDHRFGKSESISQMKKKCSIDTLKIEIDRCEVRCANCHRRRHYYERHASVIQE